MYFRLVILAAVVSLLLGDAEATISNGDQTCADGMYIPMGNVYTEDLLNVGSVRGGTCTCPNGIEYQVGAYEDDGCPVNFPFKSSFDPNLCFDTQIRHDYRFCDSWCRRSPVGAEYGCGNNAYKLCGSSQSCTDGLACEGGIAGDCSSTNNAHKKVVCGGVCLSCPIGKYSNANHTAQATAENGFSSACADCDFSANKYSSTIGATTCSTCPDGKFAWPDQTESPMAGSICVETCGDELFGFSLGTLLIQSDPHVQVLNSGEGTTAQQLNSLQNLLTEVDTDGNRKLSREELNHGLELVEVYLSDYQQKNSKLWCQPLTFRCHHEVEIEIAVVFAEASFAISLMGHFVAAAVR